ncbi:GNAT family N-acetyltransferase [Streptomyces sp. NPDC060205]|uniref:GNAT family N-acetyltransferase n=1 Tax=Streptomyces sp. NPDC060205 TaxID=3347072 RepID=UPI00365CA653
MPPPDASTDAADAAAGTGIAPGAGVRSETDPAAGGPGSPGRPYGTGSSGNADTLDLRLPEDLLALFARDAEAAPRRTRPAHPLTPAGEDLLDRVGDWGQTATAVGVFHLVPVHLARDLPLIRHWMNDPAVAAFWELAGPGTATEDHLRTQLDGDGRSVPCLGVLDGTPMSYWEIYRADLDPLARHYPARLHDTGIHLLIGGVAHRGRGLGTILLRAVSDLVLDRRPSCARVVAEPDLRNTPSVSAFLSAGFRFSAEVELPDKKAALMVRDRALRDLL